MTDLNMEEREYLAHGKYIVHKIAKGSKTKLHTCAAHRTLVLRGI